MRLFIAVDFNELKDYFTELQKQLPEAKSTLPKDFHLTLKFLGEVEDSRVEKIREALRKIKFKPFEAKVTNIGYFTPDFLKVVFVDVDNAISKLQSEIDTKLEAMFKKEANFHPHLTIARIKFVKDKKGYIEALNKIKTDEKKVKIDSFQLIKSTLAPEGPIYEVVEEFS